MTSTPVDVCYQDDETGLLYCGYRYYGLGVSYYPAAAERANGFRIGSDKDGNQQARGQFDELETFNLPPRL
jgi:hypothetical protein